MRERLEAILIPDGLRNEVEENPLWKHWTVHTVQCTLEYGGEKVEFCMTALKSFRSC